VLDLTFLNQILDCACHFFDGHVRVNAMLIEEIDDIGVEPLEGGGGDLLNVFRFAVEATATLPVGLDSEAELGGNHHLFTKGSKSLAHEFFVGKRAVGFSGVEERYATFVRLGKVYGNRMVDLEPRSAKLRARALRLVGELGGVPPRAAARLLAAAGGRAKPAIVMARLGVDAREARRRLAAARGFLRGALDA